MGPFDHRQYRDMRPYRTVARNRRQLAVSSSRLVAYSTSSTGPADREPVSGIEKEWKSDKASRRKASQRTTRPRKLMAQSNWPDVMGSVSEIRPQFRTTLVVAEHAGFFAYVPSS
jgi:hypothetical protein